MSLPDAIPSTIPEDTRTYAEALFEQKSDLFRFIGDHLDAIFGNLDFGDYYSTTGRPAVAPVILSLACIFQLAHV